MMEENQFHYTLITTYSSGRHLCTDPVPANSVPVCVHVWGCGGRCGGLSWSIYYVLNYINASVMPDEDTVLLCSFQVCVTSSLLDCSYFEGCGND